MLFKSIVASALLATGAFAQYGGSDSSYGSSSGQSSGSSYGSSGSSDSGSSQSSGSSSSSSSSSSQAGQVQVQVVQVSNSNGSLAYFPDQVTAAPGSFVQFQFHPKNHTVTQSTFANPCVPLTESMPNVTSMVKSGFMPVAADASSIPVYTIQINDTKPVWIYCGQTGHCKAGMVMAINVNDSSANTLAAYKANAAQFNSSTSSSSGTSGSGSSSTSSSGTATQTTNAASKPVAGWAGLALAFAAGFAMLV